MVRLTLAQVKSALSSPRPGFAVQQQMSPRPRPGETPPPPPRNPSREAGVLILLYLKNGELHFVLTRRTDTVAMHKGQISLPGGAREEGESLVDTALRETFEELGVPPDRVEILGEPLTPLYIPVSGFWVTAFVGYWRDEPVFGPAPDEVFELIHVPVRALLDEGLVREEEWEIRGQPARVPFFDLFGHKVWGATAMILSEFAALLKQQLSSQEHHGIP